MKVGDLVCLYRRKQQGVGIILNKKSLQESELKLIKEAQRADWKQKEVLKQHALRITDDAELVHAAFLYNLWQRNAKLKKDFVYIKWFQRPSEYEQTKTTTDSDWFPLDWAKRIY